MKDFKAISDESHESSDIIFIGSVSKVDQTTGEIHFQVERVLKGDSSATLTSLEWGCAWYPRRNVTGSALEYNSEDLIDGSSYIVYADTIDGTPNIRIDECGATRSISSPNVHFSYFFVYGDSAFESHQIKMEALEDLRAEIEELKNSR